MEEKDSADVEAAVSIASSRHPMRVLTVIRHQYEAPCPAWTRRWRSVAAMGPVSRWCCACTPPGPACRVGHAAAAGTRRAVVAWWYSETPAIIAYDPLGVFASGGSPTSSVTRTLHVAAPTRRRLCPRDTDLTWTVITPWRAALASAFDTCIVRHGRWSASNPSIHRRSCSRLAVQPARLLRAGGDGRGQSTSRPSPSLQ